MREILFRGKALDTGEWVYGGIVHQTDCYGDSVDRYFIIDGTTTQDYEIGFETEVDFATVGQFTGLYDKDGKRIFEGDIVKIDNEVFVMMFVEGFASFDLRHPANMRIAPRITTISVKKMEVAGNRWDNPELLK